MGPLRPARALEGVGAAHPRPSEPGQPRGRARRERAYSPRRVRAGLGRGNGQAPGTVMDLARRPRRADAHGRAQKRRRLDDRHRDASARTDGDGDPSQLRADHEGAPEEPGAQGRGVAEAVSLAPDTFTYAVTKDGRIRISHQGRVVTTVAGQAATRLSERLKGASEADEQQLLARATGNFKRGNERR